MTRLLTAAILIPITWWTCKRAPFPVFLAIAMTTIGICAWECLGLLRARGSRPFTTLGVAFSLLVVWSYSGLTPGLAPIDAIVASAVLLPALSMWRRDAPDAMLDAVWSTLLPIVFEGQVLYRGRNLFELSPRRMQWKGAQQPGKRIGGSPMAGQRPNARFPTLIEDTGCQFDQRGGCFCRIGFQVGERARRSPCIGAAPNGIEIGHPSPL